MVNSSGTLFLRDLTLQGGDSGPTYCGGALLNAFGQADLIRTTITESTAPDGGGICNSSGPMTLTDCVLTLNTASGGEGGALLSIDDIATPPTLNIDRTSVTYNTGAFGGGIATYDTEVVIIRQHHQRQQGIFGQRLRLLRWSGTGARRCGDPPLHDQ